MAVHNSEVSAQSVMASAVAPSGRISNPSVVRGGNFGSSETSLRVKSRLTVALRLGRLLCRRRRIGFLFETLGCVVGCGARFRVTCSVAMSQRLAIRYDAPAIAVRRSHSDQGRVFGHATDWLEPDEAAELKRPGALKKVEWCAGALPEVALWKIDTNITATSVNSPWRGQRRNL